MNLAIDIGNTATKFGVFNANELKHVVVGKDALGHLLANYSIRRSIISRSGTDTGIEAHLLKAGIPFIVVSSKLNFPFKIAYHTPHTLGADRLAGAVGAWSIFAAGAILKIDFGTCITYDIVNDKNEYLGGAISPGMLMRFKALNQYTAALPLVEPAGKLPVELTGTDTTTSILSGVINGIALETDGIIKQYNKRFAGLKVVVTGGDMEVFGAMLKSEIFARPYLVLEGLNYILNNNP